MAMLMIIVPLCLIHPEILAALELGPVTIRFMDMAWIFVLLGLFCRMCARGSLRIPREVICLFAPLVPFVAWIGVSILFSINQGRDQFLLFTISYLRLLVTLIGGFLVGIVLRSQRHLVMFQGLLIMGILCSIMIAAVMAGTEPAEAEEMTRTRYAGLMGINSLGLVSALLILYALVWPQSRQDWLFRMGLVAVGVLGFVLSRSASSIGATAAMTGLLLTRRHRMWRYSVALPAMLAMAVAAVWWGRTTDLEGLVDLSSGSFAHRSMLAYGGLMIWLDHPLTGVGWQGSLAELVARSRGFMTVFPLLPEHYFPQEDNPLSVHNLYIQLVSELGLVGLTLFGYACWRICRQLRLMRAAIPAMHPGGGWPDWCGPALGLLLLWWNTNPLYGGQTESLLAMVLLGSTGAALGIARREVAVLN